jgi:hypothetical protein
MWWLPVTRATFRGGDRAWRRTGDFSGWRLWRPLRERHRQRSDWTSIRCSGRGSISLGVDNEDGEKPEEPASWGVFLGLASYAEVVPKLFAWADAHVHQETYDESEYDQYKADCCLWDEEAELFGRVSFEEWRRGLDA